MPEKLIEQYERMCKHLKDGGGVGGKGTVGGGRKSQDHRPRRLKAESSDGKSSHSHTADVAVAAAVDAAVANLLKEQE